VKTAQTKQSMMREFPNEVLLQVFSDLPRSDWKSVRLLSKAWSVSGAKQVFNEIRVGPSDRAMLSLTALSSHGHLREIPVEAQLVQPNLSAHEFLIRLLRQIRLCSLCWGWPPSSEATLPGSDAIMTYARLPLPLSSVDLVWREGELCANSALRSRYTAYLDFVNQQQRWTPSRQRDLLGKALPKLPNIRHVIFTATWLTAETSKEWLRGRGAVLLGLDPIQQAPVGDHLSDLVHILGNSFQSVKSLTVEINSEVTITDRRSYFLQRIEKFTARLGPCFRVEDAPSLINLIGYMTRLQTLDVQFNSYNGVSDTSFWALQGLLQMPTCNSTSFTRLCLTNAAVFIDDLVNFAQRQPMVQEIVLSDSVIVHHDGKAKPTANRTQSFWLHRASLMESHGGHVKVSIIFS